MPSFVPGASAMSCSDYNCGTVLHGIFRIQADDDALRGQVRSPPSAQNGLLRRSATEQIWDSGRMTGKWEFIGSSIGISTHKRASRKLAGLAALFAPAADCGWIGGYTETRRGQPAFPIIDVLPVACSGVLGRGFPRHFQAMLENSARNIFTYSSKSFPVTTISRHTAGSVLYVRFSRRSTKYTL